MQIFLAVFFLFAGTCVKAQTDKLTKCPTLRKTQFLIDTGLGPRMNLDTNINLVFRYVQYYDCPDSRHDEFTETLFFAIPQDSTRFTRKFRHMDSHKKE